MIKEQIVFFYFLFVFFYLYLVNILRWIVFESNGI